MLGTIEALQCIITGIVLASGRIFGEAAALIYTAGQSAPALDWSNWNIFSVTQSNFRSSVRLKPWLSISGRSIVKEPFQTRSKSQLVLPQFFDLYLGSLTLEPANSEVTSIKTNICLKEKKCQNTIGMRDTSLLFLKKR